MDDLISKLSEIRSDYNCFIADEEPYYRALSEAIRILAKRVDGDTISRQAAIDAVRASYDELLDFKSTGRTIADSVEDIISNLPSAQSERKKGEWIPEFDGKFTGGGYWFSCSKCNRIVPEVRNGGWNFCPNCGADMRGGDK